MDKKQSTTTQTTITIKGVSYPCYVTMGALLLYKRITGREMNEVTTPSLEDTMQIIYCVAKAASMAEGIEFPFADVVDFASHLTPDQVSAIRIA